jgi:hypothetical protein
MLGVASGEALCSARAIFLGSHLFWQSLKVTHDDNGRGVHVGGWAEDETADLFASCLVRR